MSKFLKKSTAYIIMFVMVFGALVFDSQSITVAEAATDFDGFTIINTAAELDTVVRNNLSGKYRLVADIDLAEYSYTKSTWTAANGWEAIGTSLDNAFSGIFDGNGYTIRGLWSKGRNSNQGLFGWINKGTVKNLTVELSGEGITGFGERKGALAGNVYFDAVIENCSAVGSGSGSPVSGTANYIGGLVGVVYQSQINSSSAININCSGFSYIAGFLGAAHGASIISKCYATGSALSQGPYAGGFAGAIYENSCVEYSYATGNVEGKGSYAGGFAAVLYGEEGSRIFRCFAFGDVNSDIFYAGGLVASVYDNSSIEQSCAYGDVSAKGYCVGGLVGEAVASTISNCYAQGNVKGTTGTGGLVGYFSGWGHDDNKSVYNSYSSGTVKGSGTMEQGAFSGRVGVEFRGTNYYDKSKNSGLQGYGTSGSPVSEESNSFPQDKSTSEMMKQETFVGWDFDTIWGIDEDETYPYFVWMPGLVGIAPEVSKTSRNLTSPDGKTYVDDIIEYTIVSANNSKQSVWENVKVSDILPEGITFIEGSVKINGIISQYIYDEATRELIISLGDIKAGDVKAVTFEASIDSDAYGLTILNSALVNGKDSMIDNNVEAEAVEPDGGKVVENKKSRTITGFVSPMVSDDLGYGDSFLDGFGITVELKESPNSAAVDGLTVKAASFSDGIGVFTLEDVPFGEYILSISRLGYLTRYMKIVISENDPDVVNLVPPEGSVFELCPGDTNMDWIVDISDILLIFGRDGVRWGDVNYLFQADLNGDGVINQADANIALGCLGKSVIDYPGAEDIDFDN